MSLTHAVRTPGMRHLKQTDFHEEVGIIIGGVDLTAGGPHATADISAALVAAAATLGRNGSAVDHQVSANIDDNGWVTGNRLGHVEVWVTATGKKLEGPSGEEVYGRLAEAGGVYTVTFVHSDGAGGDTAISIPADTYDLMGGYCLWSYQKPGNANRTLTRVPVMQDAGSAAGAPTEERLTLAANIINSTGDLPALANTPRPGTPIWLTINDSVYGVRPVAHRGISIAGQTITLDTTPAGLNFPGETSDDIVAHYNI